MQHIEELTTTQRHSSILVGELLGISPLIATSPRIIGYLVRADSILTSVLVFAGCLVYLTLCGLIALNITALAYYLPTPNTFSRLNDYLPAAPASRFNVTIRQRRVATILSGIIAIVIVTAFITPTIPSPFYLSFAQGDSMKPTYTDSEAILVDTTTSPNVDDVGVYRDESRNSYVAHRVLSVDNGVYKFRGDNNWRIDPPVSKDNVLGEVVWHTSVHPVLYYATTTVIVSLILLPLRVFFLWGATALHDN